MKIHRVSGQWNIFFAVCVTSRDIFYSYNVHNSDHLFGCVGLRDKHYCILTSNIQRRIRKNWRQKLSSTLSGMPYIDKREEFINTENFSRLKFLLSHTTRPWRRNSRRLHEKKLWEKNCVERPGGKNYAPTKTVTELPDRIDDVDDTILDDVIDARTKANAAI